MELGDLENEADERGEVVYSKDRVKHSEMNDLYTLLILSWFNNGRNEVITAEELVLNEVE